MEAWNCPDTLYGRHGDVDPQGKCVYCGHKVGSKKMRGRSHPDDLPSNAELSYKYMYDPDFGSDYHDIWPV
jgi:hypothetical protein